MVSALISGYEVAFFSIGAEGRLQLMTRYSRQLWAHQLSYFHEASGLLLATLLASNTLVNLAISLLVFRLGQGSYGAFLSGGAALGLILLFGEILPKVVAVSRPVLILRLGTTLVLLAIVLIYPLTSYLERFRRYLERRLPVPSKAHELLSYIALSSPEALPAVEKDTLRNLILLRSLPVKAFMIARMDVRAIPYSLSWAEVKAAFRELPYIRVPVYGMSLDDIRGVLYLKDLLPHWPIEKLENWQVFLRPAYFVPETKNAYETLLELKNRRQHLAIVVDEYGNVAGVVTLQRLLELVFGYGEEERLPGTWYERLADGSLCFQAQTPLMVVQSQLQLSEDFFEEAALASAENIADLVLHLAGRIPQKGEKLQYRDYVFEVMEATAHRIERIRVYRQLSGADSA